MNKPTVKFLTVLTLVSLVVSVFSATIIWVAIPKESTLVSFLLLKRSVWVLIHIASSVSMVAGILFFVAVNWAKLRNLFQANPKSKESQTPQEVIT